MSERWRAVPGYPAYSVSDKGNVWSAHCRRQLRPGRMPSGHLSVALGRGNSRCVHELVLLAFVGPRPPKHEARHLDGDPANNALTNLAWSTRGRNVQDKKWHSTPKGFHKLTAENAAALKAMLADKVPQRKVARAFGVSRGLVSAVAAGKVHADV